MRILKISGRNLASLAGEFCVDFEQEPLASSGLFAISGPTGAGKSTLLDAMCLALYDATPRLLKRKSGNLLPDVGSESVSVHDPRTLLRRGAAEAWSEVDFVGSDGLRYRARWTVRRSYAKAAGALQKARMSLHRLPELIALGGTNTEVLAEIEQRVGLSFEQFTRAVLLAQNEFSAFLKTEENERGELLETLTGSAIYSAISKRAFERFRMEQNRMRELSARLADQAPLAAEERAALDAQAVVADAALAALDERRAVLERQLRWQQESARLAQQLAQAETALAGSSAAQAEAGARRRHLATIDAVQPSRALLDERARLGAEAAAAQHAIAACTEAVAQATAQQEQAAQAFAACGERLAAAEQAQRAAGPMLDQAKALDATIGALAPAHGAALEARDAAARELDTAKAAAAALAARLSSGAARDQQLREWLDAHRAIEPLAAQWPRWDKLFAQAEREAAREQAMAAELAQARAAQAGAREEEQRCSAALATASEQLAALESARQQAIAALAGFDTGKLRAERQALDQRRDSLASLEKTLQALGTTRSRLEHADARASEIAQSHAAAQALLAQATMETAAIEAARLQSERSRDAARLACGSSVTKLRATLEDDAPCPVCGSESHPYQHQDEVLAAMLSNLEEEVTRCRARAGDNLAAVSAQRAIVASSQQQAAVCRREKDALQEAFAAAAAAWDADPLAAEAPADGERAAWFSAQLQQLRARSQALDALEQSERQAAQARDAAQAACDRGAAERERLQDCAAEARTAALQAAATHAALLDKHAQASAQVTALLEDLDAAFADGDAWRDEWREDAVRMRARCATHAANWQERAQQQVALTSELAALRMEHGAAGERSLHAADRAAFAQAGFEKIDAELAARRRERAALWDGKPVRAVEAELAAAIDDAKARVAAQQAAREQAAHAETRARESLAHNTERLAILQRDAHALAERLAQWLADFAQQHPELDAVDGEGLAALAAPDPAWLVRERAALSELDAAVARAATVLDERRARLALHQQSAGAEPPPPAAQLEEAFAALDAERRTAHDAAGALRLQVAQDNVRREQARSVLADIEAQQAVERRWAEMNELIGSADGKKFRNYAQQFTLDVLLGYANSHLAQLARRYRLERVSTASGPSLGLLVRDQDMGGEIRSVNSLSGGESFLVSLALALGLASLSSNRVRVESLFIDEGFGSLDSDTLRVAMDALDGLQSMGRKVGVISHVQEMTERIATRIVVRPAGAGTSSVTIE